MPADVSDDPVRPPDEVLRSAAELARIEPAWRALADVVPGLSYFCTPDWVLGWWETMGRGAPGTVGVWRGEDGTLDAVVPLIETRHRLHPRAPLGVAVQTNTGSGPGSADHCGFAATPETAAHVASWLAIVAARRPILLANLDPGADDLLPPGSVALDSSGCPRVELGDGLDADNVGGSAKFRKQLRAYRRKVDGLGVTFRWVGPSLMTTGLLDTVVELHERRARQAGWTSAFTPDRRALHARLLARAGPGHGPAMVLAECGDRPVAALYGFRHGDVFAHFQTGWDAEFAGANLATVLVAEAIERAASDGATVYDFLRGAEPYKYRFGAVDRTDRTWLVGAGVTGRVLRRKFRIRARRTPAERGADGQGAWHRRHVSSTG